MSDLVRIPFRGTEVLAVDVAGKPHVVLKPFVEALGLAYQPQHRKLAGKSWASVTTTVMQLPGDAQRREVTIVPVRTALMLLATIDENRVPEGKRPLLVAYQAEVADVIEAYWTQGGAINPRATEDQLDTLTRTARAQMEIIQLAKGVIDPTYLDAQARTVLARAMGTEAQIEPGDIPVDVTGFLTEKGVKARLIGKHSGNFGKRLKALYEAEHGVAPQKVSRFINGAYKEVNGYFGRDLPLFERVYAIMRADLEGRSERSNVSPLFGGAS